MDAENAKTHAGDEEFRLQRSQGITMAAMMTLTLMAALDGSSISVTLPNIADELHATVIESFWAGISFLLCCAVFQPIYGSLSALFGRKIFVLIAITFFFIGAVVAGTAHSVFSLLFGRSLQGVGGGGIITLTPVLIADYVPLKYRAKYFGYLSAMWAIGSVIGPIIGGCFAERSTWRWIFYINFPFIGIGTILTVLFMPWDLPTRRSIRHLHHQIDYIGITIFLGSASSFLIPLSWGGIMFPWQSWHTLVPLLVGFAGFIVLGGYECRYAAHPLIPPAIVQNRTAIISESGFAAIGFLLWTALYYLPLYYEAVKGYGPIVAGVALLPGTLTVAPAAGIVGFVVTNTGRYRWAVWIGWLFSTLGFGVMCILKVDTSIPGWVFLTLASGVGLGMCIISISFALQASMEARYNAMALTMATFFRSLGQSIGVAVGGAVFENRVHSCLMKYPGLGGIADRYSRDVFGVIRMLETADERTKYQIREAYVESLRIVWAICCALSGVALVSSLFMKAYKVR